MHGGIGPMLKKLTQIRSIPRPTLVGDFGILQDLLWADPGDDSQKDYFEYNKSRGCSYKFNNNALTRFLTENNLLMIVRAHEVVMGGYGFKFDRKCVTVFSAKNYGATKDTRGFGNFGAVLEMTKKGEELNCSFEMFWPDKRYTET
jgi:serine/threonine-protein phosphatase PP1 catalytic subunit